MHAGPTHSPTTRGSHGPVLVAVCQGDCRGRPGLARIVPCVVRGRPGQTLPSPGPHEPRRTLAAVLSPLKQGDPGAISGA
jgi:hypothetical protein